MRTFANQRRRAARMLWRKAVALTATVPLLLAGCGTSSGGSGSGGGGKAPGTVRIGLSQGFILNQTIVMLADGLGYYNAVAKKFGTKVDLAVETTNTIGQSAFFGHSIDFYQGSISGLLPPAAKGEDVASIFTHYTGTATVMIGANKYKTSRGTDVSKYGGANWCFTTVGSNSETTSRYVAKDGGLNWSKQHGIAVGNTAALLPTMQAGRCDMAAMDTNSAAKAISQKIGYLVENPQTVENQSRVFGGSVLGLVTWASHSFTSKYPALTQALVEAQLKALRFAAKNAKTPNEIYKVLPKSFTETTSQDQFAAGWAAFSAGVVSNSGGASAAQVKTSIAVGNSVGANVKSVPAETFDNTFIRKAYQDLKLSVPTELTGS